MGIDLPQGPAAPLSSYLKDASSTIETLAQPWLLLLYPKQPEPENNLHGPHQENGAFTQWMKFTGQWIELEKNHPE